MFLVKSCKRQYNPKTSKTIRIGSLSEYREIEDTQIADKEEGHFRINFDLSNKLIGIDLFNYLNDSHRSALTARIDTLSPGEMDHTHVFLKKYQAGYEWINNNRFIFCITKVNTPEEALEIFPDYDDYWHVNIFQMRRFLNQLSDNLLLEIKERTSSGEELFDIPVADYEKLSIDAYQQEIIYRHRDLYLGNNDIGPMEEFIKGLFENIKFIKPDSFSHEKELRLIFDVYYDGALIHPKIKSIIIPSTGLDSLISKKP